MVLSMKMISLGFDCFSKDTRKIPSLSEFMSYAFCINTAIFGPWISFTDHCNYMKDTSGVSFVILIIFQISFMEIFFL